MKSPVAVVGAGVVAPWGLGWRGASTFLDVPRPSRQLRASHPQVVGFEVPELQPDQDAGDRRQRKLMSQGARLGAIAIREALRDAGWQSGREQIGCFMGVGASGARMEEIPAVLDASMRDGLFSEAAFGERGLYACNPLFVFQLMNNFSLCHGAIIEGIGGPNGAFYSRGAGTWVALEEAVAALEDPGCPRVLAGGTDSAHHAVTWAELRLHQELPGLELIPSEGAAVLALERRAAVPLAWITSLGCGAWPDAIPAPDAILLSAWNATLLAALGEEALRCWPGSPLLRCRFGEALAAGPALGWAAGLDLLIHGLKRGMTIPVTAAPLPPEEGVRDDFQTAFSNNTTGKEDIAFHHGVRFFLGCGRGARALHVDGQILTAPRGSDPRRGLNSVLVLTIGVDGQVGHLCLQRHL